MTAQTLGSLEYDREPREVLGILSTRWTEAFGGYWQCEVGGRAVDPKTIKPVE